MVITKEKSPKSNFGVVILIIILFGVRKKRLGFNSSFVAFDIMSFDFIDG